MRETIKDTLSLLAERFYYLLEDFYRRANTDRPRRTQPRDRRGKHPLQALPTRRVSVS